MKRITLLCALLLMSSISYAQSSKITSWVKASGIDSIDVKKEYKENTDFDNFYDKKGNVEYLVITEKDASLLKLENTEDVSIYVQHALGLSSKFTSIIFSYATENELKTILINYNLTGEKVGTLEVAYDEIAESAFRNTSVISKNNIIMVEQNYFDDPPSYTTNTYKIESDGKITKTK